jgi:flagellar hook-associated protein 1 FlgK
MSGLIDSLHMAVRSLHAQQSAMNVTGQNIANVNTPGYTRRVVDFSPVPPTHGGGVEIENVRAVRDALLERRLLQQIPLGTRDAAIAETLAVLEAALGAPGASLDASLDGFFDALAGLAEEPMSDIARRQVQSAGTTLAVAFGEMADRFTIARRDADVRIRGAVDEIDTLAARIAEINRAMPQAQANGDGRTLEDEQAQLLRRLSELADVHVISRADGGVDVAIGNGRPLVLAENVYRLQVTTAAGGFASLSSQGVDVTGEVTGGVLGGLLHARDTVIPGYLASLDTLAFETAAQVNALHAAGFDLAGNPGGVFFSYSTPPAGTSGAAQAVRLDPAIAADTGAIAAAGVPLAGDNGTARALAALRDARVLNGGTATLHDGWAGLVYQVGRDSQAASSSRDTHAEIVRQVDALRDQVSGVSLDEEALNLLKFQRAYEANAKFFTAVDRMLTTLLNLVE